MLQYGHAQAFWFGSWPRLVFRGGPEQYKYTLKSYDVGSGGTSNSSSTNYRLNGITGAQAGNTQSSASVGEVNGVNITQNANEPPAPTISNPGGYYDKLKLVINTANNPSDTKYLIAISPDGFTTTTNYVQSDNSVGSSQALTNYQTYAAWGGSTGFNILGLAPSTTYTVKVKALHGDFSGSPFSPTSNAATIAPSVTFSLTTSVTSTPPFAATFAIPTNGVIVNADADPIVTLTSNADNGGTVYIQDLNTGLTSVSAATTLNSTTVDLASIGRGYGAQIVSATQSAGGPLTSQSPFNGTAGNVGGLTTALQPIFASAGPITAGSGTVRLKAKVAPTTPAATDYLDVITFVTAMTY